MAGIQMGGLASGLDTASLISQLMQVERIPRGRIERNQAAVQQRQDHLKELATRLKALRTATSDLNQGALWSPVKTATSADATKVGARTLGTTATPGTYDVEVTRLATSQTEKWTTTTQNNASTLRVKNDTTGVTTDVSIAANATIDQIVAAVNANTNVAVVASKDPNDGKLVLTAKSSGTTGAFTVSNLGNDVMATRDLSAPAVDAAYTVNGAAKTSTSNVDAATIPGVEFNLAGLTGGTPVRITVAEQPADKAAVAAKMKAYVEAYNGVVDFARAKLSEKGVANPATMTDAKRGVLFGDTGLSNVLSTLRRGLMDPVAGNPATLDEMHEIGLSTGAAVATIAQDKVQGKLVFDEAKFNKAWDTDRAGLEKLLRGDGVTGGFTQRMDAMLKPMTDVGGLLDGRINSAGSDLKRLGDSLARMDKRLERKEQFYRRQFTSLESALAKAQTMQNELAGQLAGLNNSSK